MNVKIIAYLRKNINIDRPEQNNKNHEQRKITGLINQSILSNLEK